MEIDRYSEVYKQVTQGSGRVENAMVACRREQVLRSIAKHPHAVVLEVGCGLDPLFSHYEGYTTHVTIEPAADFVAHARALAADKPVEVVHGFLQSSVSELRRHTYDLIVASGLLHEVPDGGELLAGIASLCGPSTVVHLDVPNMRSFHRLLAQEMGLIPTVYEPSELDKKLGHTGFFDKDQLVAAVRAAGFDVLEFGTYFVKTLANAQLEAAIQQGIVSAEILVGLAKMARHMPELGAEMYVELRLSAR